MKVIDRFPNPTGTESAARRPLLPATAVAAGCLLVVGVLGTLSMRQWGRVPFSVPSWPWYHSWPSYLFWQPELDLRAALAAVPVALLAAATLVGLAVSRRPPRAVRLAGSLAAVFALALAVAALTGGPAAWAAPLAFVGEYPGAVDQVGAIPGFLGEFPARVPTLPDFAAQHPPFATVFYVLVDRAWPGLHGAALATVAAGCLGLLVVAGLARDELGEAGERWAVACWALAPITVLYAATSADGMWAPVLAGAALAADRGLQRRSLTWTLAGGVLLWLASMLTFAAALVLPFLAVRALARWIADGPGWVLRWAAVTSAVVLGLAGGLWLATGYDVVAAVRSVHDFWSSAPGTQQRVWWVWVFGDLVAFCAILGFPLAAALVVGVAGAVRERAWGSLDTATLAALLTAAAWGHTRGEVERMWQFLVPFAVVVSVRQLLRWRAGLPLVAGLLLAQGLAVQVLFFTRW
jgi:methylthioxylose transferase